MHVIHLNFEPFHNVEFDTSLVVCHYQYFTYLCATLLAEPFYWSEFYCQGPQTSLTEIFLQEKNSHAIVLTTDLFEENWADSLASRA